MLTIITSVSAPTAKLAFPFCAVVLYSSMPVYVTVCIVAAYRVCLFIVLLWRQILRYACLLCEAHESSHEHLWRHFFV